MLYRSFKIIIIIFFCMITTPKIKTADFANNEGTSVAQYMVQQRQDMQHGYRFSYTKPGGHDPIVSAGTMLGFYCISYVYEKLSSLSLYLKNNLSATTNEQESRSTPADPLTSSLTEQIDLLAPKEEPADPLNPSAPKQLNPLAPEKNT